MREGKRRVVVIGGGLAGIAAALDCVDAGAHVTLFEVRPQLGGAAYSFQRDGLWLDNGQHVFLRCCTAYRELLERLGSSGRVRIQRRLQIPVLSPGGKVAVLRRSGLPAPLHLAGALARYPHLSLSERLSAARAALALARLDPREASRCEQSFAGARSERLSDAESDRKEGTGKGGAAQGTLGKWLAEHGQDSAAVASLWDLIVLPTLNLPAAQGSLALGAFVLRTGLLEHNDAGDIGFHMRPLSETLGQPAMRVLREAGVELRLGVRVQRVEHGADGLRVHAEGAELDADGVVCAVPHTRAAPLLERLLGAETKPWAGLGRSPIVNVHIVYDKRVCDFPFAASVGTPVQYVFDRTDAVGLSEGQYLAVSLSGATREMGMSSEELAELYLRAMGDLFPPARGAKVHSVHVSREHAATFAAKPGVGALRPGARTSVPGLGLAGAWTDTGWPATLEGAVLSGRAAASVAMQA